MALPGVAAAARRVGPVCVAPVILVIFTDRATAAGGRFQHECVEEPANFSKNVGVFGGAGVK
jgi:hypothetical protein